MPGVSMSTKSAVMPRWAESTGPVRVSSTQRCAYWARLVQTFCPRTLHPSRVLVARQDSAARLLPVPGSEKPWHQVSSPRSKRGTLAAARSGDAKVDHRGRQHFGHRIDAGLHEVAFGQRLSEVGAEQRRFAETAHRLGPAVPHPPGIEQLSLDGGQLGHLLVEGAGATALSPQLGLVLVQPRIEGEPERAEVHHAQAEAGERRWCGGRPPGQNAIFRYDNGNLAED